MLVRPRRHARLPVLSLLVLLPGFFACSEGGATGTSTDGTAVALAVAPPAIAMMVGTTAQISASAADQHGMDVTATSVSYSSSAPSVATVNATGLVRGLSAGSALITVMAGSVYKVVTVAVIGAGPVGVGDIIMGVPGRPFGIRVSSGNLVAVTQQDLNSISLLDLSGTAPRRTLPVGADPGDVVFDRAGTVAFVSGFNDGSVKRVTLGGSSVAHTVSVGVNAYRLALAPDDLRLYVSSVNGTLSIVNVASNSVLLSSTGAGSVQGMALTPDGKTLYTTSGVPSRITRRDAFTLAVIASAEVTGIPQEIAVAPTGSELWVANEAGWIDVLDAGTLVLAQRIQLAPARPFALAISPDEAQVIVSSAMTGEVLVIDRASRSIRRTIRVSGTPRRVAFTPNGSVALVANEGGWINVIR